MFIFIKKLHVFLNIPNVFFSLLESFPNDLKKTRKKTEFQVCRSLRKIPQRSGPSFLAIELVFGGPSRGPGGLMRASGTRGRTIALWGGITPSGRGAADDRGEKHRPERRMRSERCMRVTRRMEGWKN
jgi:hypothetical protein